jgi:SAM-dependent methyltransferase
VSASADPFPKTNAMDVTPEARPVCYLCGATDAEVVADKFRYDTPKTAYRCRACGLVYIYPRMSPDEERAFYEREYGIIYSAEKSTTPADLFAARQGEARLFLQWTEPYLRPTDAALEIGCASGYFLDLIRPRVAGVAGVETHNELREYASRLDIQMSAALSECPSASFDLVFVFFVLEHIGDPLAFLAEIRRVARPGARAIFVVPNVDDALLSVYRIAQFRDFYFTPAHQFYYSPATMTRLFQRAGFERFDIVQKQRYDLSNHMQWMMDGRPGGMGRFDAVFPPSLNAEYRRALEAHHVADALLAVVTLA